MPPGEAFELFTAGMASWWPFESHSRAVDQYRGVSVEHFEFEQHVGGRLIEHLSNGETVTWATVLVWMPPERLVLEWKPNASNDPATEVEITLTPTDDGTLLLLEHRGWEHLGGARWQLRRGYEGGWVPVLARFVAESKRGSEQSTGERSRQ